jgi:hypothetical protein
MLDQRPQIQMAIAVALVVTESAQLLEPGAEPRRGGQQSIVGRRHRGPAPAQVLGAAHRDRHRDTIAQRQQVEMGWGASQARRAAHFELDRIEASPVG